MKALYPLSGLRHVDSEFDAGWRDYPAGENSDKFMRAQYDLRAVLLGKATDIEHSVHEGIRQKNAELRVGGQFVPWETFFRSESALSRRDLMAGVGAGSTFVEWERLPKIQDALRSYSAVVASGAQILPLNGGNVSWPRWATPSTPAAYAETAAASNNTQTSSTMLLSAKRITSVTVLSRQLLMQTSNMELEKWVQTEMLRSIGATIDGYALTGGSGVQPVGLLNLGQNVAGGRDLSKIQPAQTFAGAATWQKILAFPSSVESTDIMPDESSGWIVSPSTKYRWMNIQKTATYPSYLLEDGQTAGFPVRSTNNLSTTNQCVFGRWSSLVIALWPLSVITDATTQMMSGNVRIIMTLFCDIAPLIGPAFAISSDAANV